MIPKIRKYLENKASAKEVREIELWLQQREENRALFKQQLLNFGKKNVNTTLDFNKEKAYKKIQVILDKDSRIIPKRNQILAAAASVTILIGAFSFWKYRTSTQIEITNTENSLSFEETSSDSTNDIRLTLADGSTKIIDTKKTRSVSNKEGQIIGEQIKNTLSFQNNQDLQKLIISKIEVPKGKILKLLLSDGSKVWLNAESILHFPQQFLEKERNRIVTLEGEAYFEIAQDKNHPFIVKTAKTRTKVLGTKFNITSYPDDLITTTTLLEGSVLLELPNSNNRKKMIPGEQASVNSVTPSIDSKKVEARDFIAWTDNRLLFKNEKFTDLIQKIERSYNVTIQNNYAELNEMRFTGEFDIENVEDILKTFQASIPFKFTNKKGIIIMEPLDKNNTS